MGRKVCLDTDVIIDYLGHRDKANIERFFQGESPTACISSITAFELRLRETNQEEIEQFIRNMEIIPFDNDSAKIASLIWKNIEKAGTPVSLQDTFIASICISSHLLLLTNNKSDFTKIKGLELA